METGVQEESLKERRAFCLPLRAVLRPWEQVLANWEGSDCPSIPSLTFRRQMLHHSLHLQHSTHFGAPGNILRVNNFWGLTQTAFFCQRILSAKCGPAVTPGEGAFVSPVREEAPLAGRPQALWSPGLIIAQGGRGWLPGRGLSLGGVREAPCEKLNPEHSHQLAAFQSVPVGPPLAFHFVDWRLCPWIELNVLLKLSVLFFSLC